MLPIVDFTIFGPAIFLFKILSYIRANFLTSDGKIIQDNVHIYENVVIFAK